MHKDEFTQDADNFEGYAAYKRPDTTHVPDGEYDLMLDHFETAFMFQKKAAKLVLHFRITNYGPYFGMKVCRFYNLKRIIGKPDKGGCFEPAPRSDFMYDLMGVLKWVPSNKRRDRIPMSIFKGKTIVGKVETVKKDSFHRTLPEAMGYSVVRSLLRVKE